MSGDDDNFVSRWSRRKAASRAGPTGPLADAVPVNAGIQPAQPTQAPPQPPAPLPPVESLTPESDFTPFMNADVDPGVKREALKVLMRDPRFNVMDGLDVYIDDYSKPDPLPPEWLEKLNVMKRLGSFMEEPEKDATANPTGGQDEPLALPENAVSVDTSKSDPAAVNVDNSGKEAV